jgi:hypothetical protein
MADIIEVIEGRLGEVIKFKGIDLLFLAPHREVLSPIRANVHNLGLQPCLSSLISLCLHQSFPLLVDKFGFPSIQ